MAILACLPLRHRRGDLRRDRDILMDRDAPAASAASAPANSARTADGPSPVRRSRTRGRVVVIFVKGSSTGALSCIEGRDEGSDIYRSNVDEESGHVEAGRRNSKSRRTDFAQDRGEAEPLQRVTVPRVQDTSRELEQRRDHVGPRGRSRDPADALVRFDAEGCPRTPVQVPQQGSSMDSSRGQPLSFRRLEQRNATKALAHEMRMSAVKGPKSQSASPSDTRQL